MKHIVFYSGGLGSWATAKRVIAKYGKENVILMFTDTLIEDKDLYRFLIETAAEIYGQFAYDLVRDTANIPPTSHETMPARREFLLDLAERVRERIPQFAWIADGRDPWQVFHDKRWIGNSRRAQCSHVLKQDTSAHWINSRFKPDRPKFIKEIDKKTKEVIYWEDPIKIAELQKEWEDDEKETCKLYLGIDWTEEHRKAAPTRNWLPYTVEFPMCEEPLIDKEDVKTLLVETGIKVPELYDLGFAHNNCGGFCCRAGQGHFANLLEKKPELYRYHEEKEEEMRQYLQKDYSILTKQKDKVKYQLTLKNLRIELQGEDPDVDMYDIGGCGCMVDDEDSNYFEELIDKKE